MTQTMIASHPSPTCPCHDCIVEFVKDYENGEEIFYSNSEYYNDEYTGPFGSMGYSRYDDWN